MSKILIKKAVKELINNKSRTVEKPRKYLLTDISKDFHCKEGVITKSQLKKKDGSKIKTKQDKEFTILTADFMDIYKKMKRGAQIISLKDVGTIIAYTGINKNSKVLDAGSGSGGLACFLAHICKEVTTYDIRDDHIEIVKENKKRLNLKNLKIKKGDIREKISEKNLNLIVFDLPDPWEALPTAKKALKVGGYLVSYSPTIPQVQDFVNIAKEDFSHIITMEIIKREWEIDGRKVRPITTQNVHTGFLTFFRNI